MTKEQIKNELDCALQIFMDERYFLMEDEASFATLTNFHLNMKITLTTESMLSETRKFIEYRTEFLRNKEKQLFHYICNIKQLFGCLDNADEDELNSIDELLKIMLASISRSAPTDVFGEPF